MTRDRVIEVAYKKDVPDPAARAVLEDIGLLGMKAVKRVATGQLYRLVGAPEDAEEQRIAAELLCDPVIQLYREAAAPQERGERSEAVMMIDVWFKAGVTDVIGESVLKGVRDLGIDSVSEVRTGSRYRIWGLKSSSEADRLASALLANPLVQDRVIHAG